jgi:hypothetical protein
METENLKLRIRWEYFIQTKFCYNSNMEITSSAEKLAQDWKLKIKDWNINAAFIAGLPLADGIVTSMKNEHGILGEMQFRMAISGVEKKHPDANLMAVFSDQNSQDIVWYKFKSFMPSTERDKRSGFGPASIYFLFDQGDGEKFVQQVKSEPTLADALVTSKFPEFAAKVEVKPWKEIIFLPQDLANGDIDTKVQVIASK